MLPTLQELRDQLDAADLRAKCQTTNDVIFSHFVDGRHLDAQNSYGTSPVDARFWISYDNTNNEFVLNVNFFTHEGVGIDRNQFAEFVSTDNAALLYTPDIAVKWVSSGTNVYTVGCPADIGVFRYFTRYVPTIIKIA